MKKKGSRHTPKRTRAPKRAKRGASRERTVTVVTGLKIGDPNVLAPQPLALANVAFGLGRSDRRTYLAEAAKVVQTRQIIGRLFSFHKQPLIDGGFLRFEKVPRSKWRAECEARQQAVDRVAAERLAS